MLTKLMQMLFVPKKARAKLAAKKPAKPAAGRRKASPKAKAAAGPGRDKLMSDTMALYRQQRADVYDTLDEVTRQQIEADAEKAFGKALRPKR